jgi:putative tryptophan/tyrosine transport system substrate-binding protein
MKAPRLIMIVGLGLTLLSAPPAALAQQPAKVYRIGVLSTAGPEQENFIWADLRGLLRERGWVEGQNLVLEWRYAEAKYERLPALAAELVGLKPDLIMARGGPGATAAKRATATIPIVMYNATDPVGIGLVPSLARPGGNLTGLSDDQDPEILGKQLQLLKEVAPAVSKVAFLTRVSPPAVVPLVARYEAALEAGAKALGLQVRQWYLQSPDDIGKAFVALRQEGFGALHVAYVPVTWINRRQILDLAAGQRLPAIYMHRTYALDGGLMAYGEDEREVPRRLVVYVDKILRGAKPADLPIQQPTKFELVVNLKTAKAMGLTIPQSLLVRADEVIR